MNNDFWGNFTRAMEQVFGVPQGTPAQDKKPYAPDVFTPSADAKAFATQLNQHLAHTRSVRIHGALTRPDMDALGEPMPGWLKSLETMPVPKNVALMDMSTVLVQCIEREEFYKRFSNSIFCGWVVASEGSAVWRLKQVVFYKQPIL